MSFCLSQLLGTHSCPENLAGGADSLALSHWQGLLGVHIQEARAEAGGQERAVQFELDLKRKKIALR